MPNNLYKFPLLLMIIAILSSCSESNDLDKVSKLTESVKNKFAPDGRVEIFHVKPNFSYGKIILSGESTNLEAVEFLMNQINEKDINVENKVEYLPSSKLGEKIYGIINISVANLRSDPKHPAELVTQSLLGTSINVLKKNDGWYLIQTPDKYIAWVDDDGIVAVNKNEIESWKKSPKFFVKSMYANSFKSPDENSEIVSDLVAGAILKKISEKNGFVKVQYPDGREGYIKKSHGENYSDWLKYVKADQKNIISTAKLFMGLPYLWGGTSSKGVDCSGFTKTVYYMNGVILPRDASQQVFVGDTVDTSEGFDKLKAGDLLFFGRKASENQKEKITHVAIYIGEGKYIHSAGKVKINSLDKKQIDFNQYRYNTFIRAKRILDSSIFNSLIIQKNEFYK